MIAQEHTTIADVLSGAAKWHIEQGDSAIVAKGIPDCSIDSIVSDPPAGIAFMGKAWDTDKGGKEHWIAWLAGILREAFRVLKPGGRMVLWALPQTSHWTAEAGERAGFLLTSKVLHLYGSGFPKSTNVAKQIDSAAGATREIVGSGQYADRANKTPKAMAPGGDERFATDDRNITAPATPEARRWEGHGSALKPAAEEWIFFQKPFAAVTSDTLRAVTGWDHWVSTRRLDTGKQRAKAATKYGVTIPDGGELQARNMKALHPGVPMREELRWRAAAFTEAAPVSDPEGEEEPERVYSSVGEWQILWSKETPYKPWKNASIAANVLAHGTGALNIDGCRVSPCSVTGQRLQSEPWEQGGNLCDSCASHAAQSERRTTPATAGSSATDNAALTTPAKAKRSRASTSKTDIGCSGGQSPGGRSGALFDDSNSSTAPSGKSTTGLFPMGTSSTTSTRSRPTTGSKTCTSCGAAITSASTRSNPTSTPEAGPLPPTRSDGETTIPSMPPSMLSRSASDGPAGRFPANLVLSHTAWEETHCPCGAVLSFVARFCPECGSGEVAHRRAGCCAVGERRVKGGNDPCGADGFVRRGGMFGDAVTEPGRYAGRADPDGLETVTAWECLATCGCGLSTLAPSGGAAPRCRCGRAMVWACPVARLDEQSGESASTIGTPRGASNGAGWGMTATGAEYAVAGGSSRFFNTFAPPDDVEPFFWKAKPSTAEREAGCERLPLKSAGELVDREDGSAGAGRVSNGRRNTHPTLKSIALMRHFVRLVTPPGGIVLDMFGGSMTTVCAAVLDGFRAIGIDMDAEYIAIGKARAAFWAALAGTKAATMKPGKKHANARVGQPSFLDLVEKKEGAR